MRQLTFEAKMEVLELYLQGLSTNKIVEDTGISKGAVISILKDAREGKFPDLRLKERVDELHYLSVRLRKEGLDLAQAKLGFALLKKLWDLNIEPGKMSEWIDFCSEISPDSPEGFIPAAMELFEIEKQPPRAIPRLSPRQKSFPLKGTSSPVKLQTSRIKKSKPGNSKRK